MHADFSLLDRSDIRDVMFYPRPDRSPTPAGAENLHIEVEPGVRVHARLYPTSPEAPSVLFFHGNGEVVADYDTIAPIYHFHGLNLLVVDYRGYGRSGGRPSFTTMLADAHMIKAEAFAHLDSGGFTHGRYLMGRSLGALSAVELAATDAEGLRGLILESGAAGIRGWNRFVRPNEDSKPWEALHQVQLQRLSMVTLPLLSIHGMQDELISAESAVEVQGAVRSEDKQLVLIPEAGHNDLLAVGMRPYFGALTAFIARCEAES